MTGNAKFRACFCVLDSLFETFQSWQKFIPKTHFCARGHGVRKNLDQPSLFNDVAGLTHTDEPPQACALLPLFARIGQLISLLREASCETTLRKVRSHEQLYDMRNRAPFTYLRSGSQTLARLEFSTIS
jgi:hypothetical protein